MLLKHCISDADIPNSYCNLWKIFKKTQVNISNAYMAIYLLTDCGGYLGDNLPFIAGYVCNHPQEQDEEDCQGNGKSLNQQAPLLTGNVFRLYHELKLNLVAARIKFGYFAALRKQSLHQEFTDKEYET